MAEVEIKRINISEECSRKCEACEKYFECLLPEKRVFVDRGLLRLIRENMKPIKHKIIVLGGKGGVGKSMLAVNLACSLALRGKKVCILDQVYDCPAVPMMMGVPKNACLMIGDKGFTPYEGKLGIKIISTGLILDADDVIVWYHDMKTNATEELLASVDYEGVDYLVADIPTGTSSETVNVLKYMPDISSSLVVTVPSAVSQNVARKSIYILRKAGVPITGVVENMSATSCACCGRDLNLIQSGAGERMAKEEGVPFLGRIPISSRVSSSLDEGEPFVIQHPEFEGTRVVSQIAENIVNKLEETE